MQAGRPRLRNPTPQLNKIRVLKTRGNTKRKLRKSASAQFWIGRRSPQGTARQTFMHWAAIVNEQTRSVKLRKSSSGTPQSRRPQTSTCASAEAERGAAITLERAIRGDLFPVVPMIENRNNFPALN